MTSTRSATPARPPHQPTMPRPPSRILLPRRRRERRHRSRRMPHHRARQVPSSLPARARMPSRARRRRSCAAPGIGCSFGRRTRSGGAGLGAQGSASNSLRQVSGSGRRVRPTRQVSSARWPAWARFRSRFGHESLCVFADRSPPRPSRSGQPRGSSRNREAPDRSSPYLRCQRHQKGPHEWPTSVTPQRMASATQNVRR